MHLAAQPSDTLLVTPVSLYARAMQSDATSNVPNTSGTGSKAQVPEETRRWSWGAFLLSR